MNNIIFRNSLRFIILILLQVVLFNNIHLSGYANPYIYIVFILLLPFETPKWAVLILSFILGLVIDTFCGTIGIHAFATVFMGLCRAYIIRLVSGNREFEKNESPTIKDLGLSWFFSYSLFLVIIHHFTLFIIETFRFKELHFVILRALLSIIITEIAILISQYLFYSSKKQSR